MHRTLMTKSHHGQHDAQIWFAEAAAMGAIALFVYLTMFVIPSVIMSGMALDSMWPRFIEPLIFMPLMVGLIPLIVAVAGISINRKRKRGQQHGLGPRSKASK